VKIRWRDYQDNIGHLYFKGCFRCHNGSHTSDKGDVISRDCNLCHDIVIQGIQGKGLEIARVGESLKFRHSENVGGAWRDYGIIPAPIVIPAEHLRRWGISHYANRYVALKAFLED